MQARRIAGRVFCGLLPGTRCTVPGTAKASALRGPVGARSTIARARTARLTCRTGVAIPLGAVAMTLIAAVRTVERAVGAGAVIGRLCRRTATTTASTTRRARGSATRRARGSTTRRARGSTTGRVPGATTRRAPGRAAPRPTVLAARASTVAPATSAPTRVVSGSTAQSEESDEDQRPETRSHRNRVLDAR